VSDITIPAVIDTMMVRTISHELDQVFNDVQFDLGYYQNELKKMDIRIKNVEICGAVNGRNEFERKSAGVTAAKNYESDGAVIDLYEMREQIMDRVSALNSVLEALDFKFKNAQMAQASMRTESNLAGR
jgi:hypothetical protein